VRPSLIAPVLLLVLVACADPTPCAPGDACRWAVAAERVDAGVAGGVEPAAVLGGGLPHGRHGLLHTWWERCRAEACPWVLALPDGSPVRVGVDAGPVSELGAGDAAAALATCIGDVAASLAAGALTHRSPLVAEIEVACRLWLHPDQGRGAMHWHPRLHAVARQHACDMAERAYFGHTTPEGTGPNRRARDAGYALPAWYDPHEDGNNIESLALRGPTSTPSTTIEQWLASPPHRRHVLGESPFGAEQHDVAVGYCHARHAGQDRHYWVFVSAHAEDAMAHLERSTP
jgi:hypothetical protein